MKNKDQSFSMSNRGGKLDKSNRDQDELNRIAADSVPEPGTIDRPGFDLGGSSGETSAGTGLGLGEDAAENRLERSLPGRRARSKLSIPRWSGSNPLKNTPSPKK